MNSPSQSISNDPATGTSRTTQIATIIVILLLVSGVWAGWRFVAGSGDSAELDIGQVNDRFSPRRALGGGMPPPPANVMREGINPIGAAMFRIQSGEFFMTLAPTETTYAPLRLYCNRADLLSMETRQLFRTVRDTAVPATAKALELSPDQLKQLAALRNKIGNDLLLPPADKTQLQSLWKNWNLAKDPAAKKPAEVALLAAMKEIGTRNLEPSRKQYVELDKSIRAVLTEQQITKARELRKGN